MTPHDDPALIDAAVKLARELLVRAQALQTPAERRQQAELDRMLRDPADKATLVQLTDQAFRSHAAARTAEQFTHILDVQGIPRFFSPLDQALLRGFQTFGGWLPNVTVPLVKAHLQHETANVVLPAEPDLLHTHLRLRRQEGVRMNLNFLGEALLGETEAQQRLEKYLAALQAPDVEVLSVKISTIDSQIWPLAREATVRRLCARLELLYREAAHVRYTHPDGHQSPKFIYLDMEEYRDLQLTAEVFMRTLSRPGLEGISGGIALQAYIPDSHQMQQRITAWAIERVAQGGAPVTIRIVKGANMEMERVDAALHGWPQAPFTTKAETDANYKRMLRYGLLSEHLAAVRLGIASHNLFDVAYALVLAAACGAGNRVQFEMLEGMANHQRRALLEVLHNSHADQSLKLPADLLLYAPACRKEEFLNAIGYLIRRLDENTGPENFLRHTFRLQPDSPDWQQLEAGFRQAFTLVPTLPASPRRQQNRGTETFTQPREFKDCTEFDNEPDTDWSLPENSRWAESLVQQLPPEWETTIIPLVIGGAEQTNRALVPGDDPSRPNHVAFRWAQGTSADVATAVATAQQQRDAWQTLSMAARSDTLAHVAVELRRARGRLMQAALVCGGKTLAESDPEVSEAIDFVEFYRLSAQDWYDQPGLHAAPLGTVVVVSPWNFPIAIPCGGIAAALAAGNSVILKPASDTVLVAWELCQCFWRGGVPRTALQFLPCPGGAAGSELVSHPDVAAVILTGGTDTALRMLRCRPDLRLFAETGGKNASIITALADRELAIKHVVHSAFSHSGQKCSATSLLLLEAEVYDDPQFKAALIDAVTSLPVGPAGNLSTRIGPLIRPPSGDLEQALKTLEPGESWAVMPRMLDDQPRLWSPGVKYGVTRGSVTHLTEFFGPLLGVMRFTSLDEAIDIVRETGYGLTGAIHSLDDREIEHWQRRIPAGNLYINRGTTGAIVLRQPFGGMGKSAVGPSMKAGGPNYVAQLLTYADQLPSTAPDIDSIENNDVAWLVEQLCDSGMDAPRLFHALASYDHAWRTEFALEHDHFQLLGEDNRRRYVPFREVCLRITPADTWYDILARVGAARITGARVLACFDLTCPAEWPEQLARWTDPWAGGIEPFAADEPTFLHYLERSTWPRIRYAAPDRVTQEARLIAAKTGTWLADTPVSAHGRLELLWYVREQSVSYDYHRYGNLGPRSQEPRRPVL